MSKVNRLEKKYNLCIATLKRAEELDKELNSHALHITDLIQLAKYFEAVNRFVNHHIDKN